MKNVFLSIIVPVYNVQEYIDDCVSSIVSQLQSEIEVILVDDGSLDDCPLICDKWASSYANIHVIHKTNGGLSDARNEGIKAARGEYVWFVDSDDWISDTAVCDIVLCLKNNTKVDAIAMQLMEVRDGREMLYGSYPKFPQESTTMSNHEYVESGYPVIPSVRYVIRRDLIKNNHLYFIPGVLHEDIPYTHKLIYLAKEIQLLRKPTYYYRIRGGSITTAPRIQSAYSLVETHKQTSEFVKSYVAPEDYKWFMNLTYDYFYEMFLRLYPFIGTAEYTFFMDRNRKYICKEFNRLWKFLPAKRRVLLICFNISPKLFSWLLYKKKNHQ